MKKKIIGEQITREELLHMREVEGMSNQEIADVLELSLATIYNAIGKQGFRTRKNREQRVAPMEQSAPTVSAKAPIITCVQEIKKYHGAVAQYTVDACGIITISINGRDICLERKDAELFATEMVQVLQTA